MLEVEWVGARDGVAVDVELVLRWGGCWRVGWCWCSAECVPDG